MPPGLQNLATESCVRGFHAPLPGFHEEHRDIARFGGEDKSKDAVRLANALWQTAY